jgi:hypothetical protein
LLTLQDNKPIKDPIKILIYQRLSYSRRLTCAACPTGVIAAMPQPLIRLSSPPYCMALLDLPIFGHRLAAGIGEDAIGLEHSTKRWVMETSENNFIGRAQTTQKLYSKMVVLHDKFGCWSLTF